MCSFENRTLSLLSEVMFLLHTAFELLERVSYVNDRYLSFGYFIVVHFHIMPLTVHAVQIATAVRLQSCMVTAPTAHVEHLH
jgi:hypothetical protein